MIIALLVFLAIALGCLCHARGYSRGVADGKAIGRDIEHNEAWCNELARKSAAEKKRRDSSGKFRAKMELNN